LRFPTGNFSHYQKNSMPMGKISTLDPNYQEMENDPGSRMEEAGPEQEWTDWMEKLSRLLLPVREEVVSRLLMRLHEAR
jgi:hypothetical protein